MEEILRRLVIRAFHITNVEFSEKTRVKGNSLFINKGVLAEIVEREQLICNMSVSILKPTDPDIKTDTIMDIIPISTKVLGRLGEGITHTLTGCYVVLTGADENGEQMHEFGSSEGMLREHLVFERSGTPSKSDIIIHVAAVVKGGLPFERSLPTAIFRACDGFIQTIREPLKDNDVTDATETHEFFDKRHPGKRKVALVKQVAGQGAMYDNLLFPDEPSGFDGGISIINVSNVPLIVSPNEYRDGALRAMD